MMSRQSSLKRNAFALITMQAINYLVPLITLPYLTRTLGAEQYGAFNLALSLVQYGILFVTFGFNLSATQYIARHRHQPLLVSRAFWETMAAKLWLLIIASIILTTITLSVENFQQIKWLVFILFLQLLSVAIDPLWLFQGIERLEKISIIGAVIRLLNIPLLLVFVHTPDDVDKAAFIQAFVFLLMTGINLFLAYKTKIICLIKYSQLKVFSALRSSFPLFIGAAAISLYNTSTPLILGLVNTYEEVGIYAASFRVQTAAIGIFTVLGQVLYPRVNHLFSQSHGAGYRFVRKLLIWMFPILLFSSVVFYFIVPLAVPWLLGEQFSESKATLQIMAPMLFLTPYCVVFAHNILLPLGYRYTYFIVPLIIGSCHIIYSGILSSHWGAIGAAYSILLTETLSFITLLSLVLYHTKFKQSLRLNKIW